MINKNRKWDFLHVEATALILLVIASCSNPFASYPTNTLVANAQYSEDGNDKWVLNTSSTADFYGSNGNSESLTEGVKLGGDSLTFSYGYYERSPLTSWDSIQIWTVSDHGSIGNFDDNIVSPRLFTITYPLQLRHNDSVSMRSGFTINYTNTRSDSVRISITLNPLLANAIDSTVPLLNHIPMFVSGLFASTGSFFVSPSDLASFPTKGIIDVHVIAENSINTTHSERTYQISSTCDADVNVFIKP